VPVLDPRFPVPDRSGQTVNTVKGEDGVLDLGWCEGVLSDGRPFRAELWAQDQITVLTFFFSVLGLETLSPDALYALVEKEGLVRLAAGFSPSFQVRTWADPSGTEFWSVNVTVGTDEETRLADSVAVVRYVPGA
jgi:hypothetical protein